MNGHITDDKTVFTKKLAAHQEDDLILSYNMVFEGVGENMEGHSEKGWFVMESKTGLKAPAKLCRFFFISK